MPPDHAPGARRANLLAHERSVYLQQHAHNPVAWHPWGAAAIAAARERRVPLFVSIGYSTCYWCHVMERESFESPAVAAVLNRVAVPVKVDREERPDIDEALMTACQVFTQLTEGRASGGWPLNVFLDPDTLQPFFCGTYYPPENAHGRPGFTQLLLAVEAAWKADAAGLRAQAERIAQLVRTHLEVVQGEGVPGSENQVGQVVDALMRVYDPTNGGFGGAPKFPTPPYAAFLLATRGHVPSIERALRHTLDRMALGGIFDQVGGGFHRYSVDAQWTVPHFEKMLYDNAQLALLYTRAFDRWGDAFDASIARRTLDSMLRDMIGEQGQFFSAQDAEVAAHEGASYLWAPHEARAALARGGVSQADADIAIAAYGLDGAPNFHDPHDAAAAPAWVLRMAARPEVFAQQRGMDARDVLHALDRANRALYAARAERPQPITDDKTIAAWSGLAIEACAVAGQVLGEPRYTAAAERAADFVQAHMRGERGGLLRIWRGGQAAVPAFLEDYACMANAFIALGRGADAAACVRAAHERFADARTGAWFDVAEGQHELWVRGRSLDDGATPSGTSSMLRALCALAPAHDDCRAWAHRLAASAGGAVGEQPVSASGTVLAAWRLHAVAPARAGEHGVAAGQAVEFTLEWAAGAREATLEMAIAPGHHVTAGAAFSARAHGATPAITATRAEPSGDGTWHGRVRVAIEFAAPPAAPPEVAVRFQVCTDRACQPPEERIVRAPA